MVFFASCAVQFFFFFFFLFFFFFFVKHHSRTPDIHLPRYHLQVVIHLFRSLHSHSCGAVMSVAHSQLVGSHGFSCFSCCVALSCQIFEVFTVFRCFRCFKCSVLSRVVFGCLSHCYFVSSFSCSFVICFSLFRFTFSTKCSLNGPGGVQILLTARLVASW